MTESPLCKCHGEPSMWNGHWRCRVKHREQMRRRRATNRAYVEREQAKARERYNADPVFRITKRLHDDAHARAKATVRMRQRLEGIRGSL